MTETPSSSSAPPTGERRARTRTLIEKLLAERAEMLVLYWRVAGLAPYEGGGSTDASIEEFCEVLVDYIAAGHFGLYERIANGTERRREVAELAEEVYPRIAETTDLVVDFNDKYTDKSAPASSSLHHDLSRLGEAIAERIELEDRLIAAMLP